MALTKVVKHLSSTPSIVDDGNATAITIDSSENVALSSNLEINDNKNLYIGDDNNAQLYYNSSNDTFYVYNSSANGGTIIQNNSASGGIALQPVPNENAVFCSPNGAVQVYHNSVSKFQTTSSGINVSGGISTGGTERISSAGQINGTSTTQSAGTNNTSIATTAYTDAAITALIGGAPGTLNTLNEIAAAINDDANYVATVNSLIAAKAPLANPDFTGQIQASNAASTIHELITTNNNTRSTLNLQSKDSSGNLVSLRMHALGDGPRAEIFTYTNHPLAFATNNAAPQMTLLTNGNFGIGTTSPTSRLHVKSAGTGNVLYIESSDGHHLGGFYQESDTRAAFNVRDASGSVKVNLDAGGNSWFTGGNVGMGTTSPSTKLEVSSGAADVTTIKASYSATNYLEIAHNRINAVSSGGNDSIALQTAGTTRAFINQSGYVGIGTTGPGRKLHIKDGQIKFQNTSSGGWAGLDYSMNGGTYDAYMGLLDSDGRFFIDMDSNGEDFTILQSGYVGIGITAPTSKLTLPLEEEGNFKIKFQAASGTGHAGISTVDQSGAGLYIGANSYANASGVPVYGRSDHPSSGIYFDGWNADRMRFYTGASGNPTEKMSILSNGNVGIGTTNFVTTGAKLQVKGTSAAPAISGSYFTGSIFSVEGTSTVNISMGTTGASSYDGWLQVHDAGNGTNYDLLLNPLGGNVGIGDTPGTNNKFRIKGTVIGTAANLSESAALAILSLNYPRGNVNSGIHFGYATANYIQAADDSGSNAKQLTLNPFGGNVGINTNAPTHPLSVTGANAKIAVHSTADGQRIGFQAKYFDHSSLYGSFEYTTGDAQLYIDNNFTGNGTNYSDINIRNKNTSGSFQTAIKIKGGNAGNNGYVGIGTTSPNARLDIEHPSLGQAANLGETRSKAGFILNSDTGYGSNGLTMGECAGTAGSYFISVTNSGGSGSYPLNLQPYGGKVGIGTTTPFSLLEINRTATDAYTAGAFNDVPLITLKHTNADTQYAGIRFTNTVGNYEHFLGSVQTSANTADMVFQGYNRTGGGAYQEFMRVKETGNVGIGTATPGALFHVQGSATPGTFAAIIENTAGGGNVLQLYNHDWDDNDHLIYATNGGTSANGYAFVVDGQSKVGIGTTDPANGFALEVKGTTLYNAEIKLNRGLSGAGHHGINWYNGTTKKAEISWGENDANVKIRNFRNDNSDSYARIDFDVGGSSYTSNPATRMVIQNTGDVGIGKTDPYKNKMKKVEVTASTAITSNAHSVNAGNNGGYDVSNDEGVTTFGGMGALTVAGVYNKPILELRLIGNLAANSWYPISTMSQLTNWSDDTGSGVGDGFSMYFRIYTYDTAVGGGEYLGSRMSERIWVNGYTCNSVQRQVLHVGAAWGHAPNNGQTAAGSGPYQLSIKHHLSGDSYYSSVQTLEFLTTSAKTGLTGTSNYNITIFGYIG